MPEKVLIVEDELIVAKDLQMILEEAGYDVCAIASSVPRAIDIIDREQPDLVLLDIYLKGPQTGIQLAAVLNERNIPFVYLSANSNQSTIEEAKRTRPYGFMVKPFREEEVLISLEIARYRHQHSLEAELQKEYLLQKQLENIRTGPGSAEQKLEGIVAALQPFIPFDFFEIGRRPSTDNNGQWYGFNRIGISEYQVLRLPSISTMASLPDGAPETMRQAAPAEINAAYFNDIRFTELLKAYPLKAVLARLFHLASNLVLPFLIDKGQPCIISFYSKQSKAYDNRTLAFSGRMQQTLSQVLSAICAETAATPKTSVSLPVTNGRNTQALPGIIGESRQLLAVLDYVKQIGPVDTSVLILGETGTGKEKIADSIHQLSTRKDKPFIKVNCAAIPVNLLESELFGHEKGSFTGAIHRRIGKFEQAHGGTIFLDEIGDVSLDVQVKMLRVLQQREVERIGGKEPIPIDIRVIAATNKNLEQEIAEGRFRMDLYFRLNVFPLWLPPLRQRIEDIPLLAEHFVQTFARRYNKTVSEIDPQAMEQLMRYNWPGNIRELENSMERSVILATGPMIDHVFIQPPHLQQEIRPAANGVKTIDEVEKEHILVILNKCNYKVYGPQGAAAMLNLPPTTLTSKMKKLGILKTRQE